MSQAIKKSVIAIRKEQESKLDADIARNALKKEFSRKSWETVRVALLPVFGQVYDVPVVDGDDKGKSKGKKVLDKDAKGYEACKRTLSNTLTFICGAGTSSGAVEAPPKLVKDITKMIIDSGIESKQFNALMTAIRSGISFQ
jgi:hypothetical protein